MPDTFTDSSTRACRRPFRFGASWPALMAEFRTMWPTFAFARGGDRVRSHRGLECRGRRQQPHDVDALKRLREGVGLLQVAGHYLDAVLLEGLGLGTRRVADQRPELQAGLALERAQQGRGNGAGCACHQDGLLTHARHLPMVTIVNFCTIASLTVCR